MASNKAAFRDLAGISGYVSGRWITAGEGDVFRISRPHDNRLESIGHGISDVKGLDNALMSAHEAQQVWSRMPVNDRATALLKGADFLRAHRQTLAAMVALEVGKPLNEATAEVTAAEEFLRCFAGWAAWGQHGTVRSTRNGRVLTEKMPRGVVGVITPWNYPVSNACQKIAAALITGNSVIWRPSNLAPASALMLTHAFEAAEMPAGTLNTLIEDGSTVSRALVASPEVQAISFTGSTAVGRDVAAVATQRGAAVQCEMGGKNAVVVMADANLADAARKIANGAFGFAGQRCTAVSRVFVEQSVLDEFCSQLLGVLASPEFAPGNPTVEPECLGPLITARQSAHVMDAINGALERGAHALCGARMPDQDAFMHGNYIEPTVLRLDDLGDSAWHTEFFGPVLTLTEVDDLPEAIQAVNDCRYGLAAAIFTKNTHAMWEFVDGVDAGVIKVNEATPGINPYVPVSGWQDSGLGPGELAEEGIDFFTRKKSSYLNDRNK